MILSHLGLIHDVTSRVLQLPEAQTPQIEIFF